MISESSYAGFWNKEPDMNIGNEIHKEEFPEGKDVEPKLETAERDTLVIKGGVEEVNDINLDDW